MNTEQKIKNQKRRRFWRIISVLLLVFVLAGGFALGCLCFSIRPTKSELEKRELTKFPEFTFSKFINGEFFSELDTWFADTFPFREDMLTAEQDIKALYGIQTDSVNAVAQGDDVPDMDALIASIGEKDTKEETKEQTKTKPTAQSAEQTTQATTQATAAETVAVDGKELAMMNPQEAGQVNVKDLVGYCVYGFNLKAADLFCQNVANLSNALKGQCQVYQVMIPNNSAIILDEGTKAAWKLSDEKKVLAYYAEKSKSLAPDVINVDIFDELKAHSSEYLYFKTDHHWTQLGAYYGYKKFCEAKGFTPHAISEYKQVHSGAFLGSYYATNGFAQLKDNPDDLIAYIPTTYNTIDFFDDTLQTMRQGDAIRDMSAFKETQKYLGFIYGDNSYSYIENPNVKNGKKCIVIKESFGNPFVPFLIDHYEKVIVVDYRSYKESVAELARKEGVQDILFVNNLEAISDGPTMEVLGNICH